MATFRVRTSVGNRGETSVGGRIFGSLFLLVFTGMGVVFTVVFGAQILRGMAAWRWETGQCVVLSSQVEELLFTLPPAEAATQDDPYRVAATYQWERGGRTYSGNRIAGASEFARRADAERALARYPAGATVPC